MQNDKLKDLTAQAADLELYQLLAGLGVLAKDMSEYLVENPRDDSADFQEIYVEVISEIPKGTWEADYLLPAHETGLPFGTAEAAAQGQLDISLLKREEVIHEFTESAGNRLLLKFRRKFRESVCGEGGPYDKFNNGLVGQEDLPVAIASALIVSGFSAELFWAPLAVYIALLLVKAGLKTYCE